MVVPFPPRGKILEVKTGTIPDRLLTRNENRALLATIAVAAVLAAVTIGYVILWNWSNAG